MNLPKYVQNAVDAFGMLPGIGPKSAQRLALYMMRVPKDEVLKFSDSIKNLKEQANFCTNCYNISENDLCNTCENIERDRSMICVVETPLDLIALEKSGFKGVYHVLHGCMNPVAGIGPDEIFIKQLFTRLENNLEVSEIIMATGTSLEDETTAMYISQEMKKRFPNIKVSRIGRGLPVGADIEYADESTLSDALSGRVVF